MNTIQDNLYVEVSHTINDIDENLWNEKIGKNHIAKTHAFLSIVERSFPSRQYFYFQVFSDPSKSKLIALFFSTKYQHNLLANATGTVLNALTACRKRWSNLGTISIAMMGNPECHGQTWWIDENYLTEADFFSLGGKYLKQQHRNAWLIIIRDFIVKADHDQNPHTLKSKIGGFSLTSLLPVAEISIKDQTAQSHKSRLKQNYRRLVRKALSDLTKNNFRVERQLEFKPLVDQLYPLYINVHQRAQEYVRDPFSKHFFDELAEHPFSEATVIYNQQNTVAAFTISVFNSDTYNPYIFGSRDIQPNDPNFYYGLMWFDLENACQRGMARMDLGITNYFPKQNFGAELLPLSMAISVKRPFSWLSSWIAKLLAEPQPPARNSFR